MDDDFATNRNFDRRSTEFQSKSPGKIIKSLRKFGIEIEMYHSVSNTIRKLSGLVPKSFGVEHDGSIDAGSGYGVEVVSPILKGNAGEEAIVSVMKTINSLAFQINKTCGLHVHLDGEGFAQSNKTVVMPFTNFTDPTLITKLNINQGDYAFAVRQDVMSEISERVGMEEAAKLLSDEYMTTEGNQLFLSKEIGRGINEIRVRNGVIDIDKYRGLIDIYGFHGASDEDSAVKGIVVDSLTPGENDWLCIVYGNRNLENVKTLLYLHTVFADVFASMLPMSRRQDNLYCQSLSLGFSAGQIEDIESYTELEKAWYRAKTMVERRTHRGNRYDDSRYFTVNLHSLFDKYGTVEIRSHSATLDPNKVLYWAAFHQEILDRIVAGDITIGSLREGSYMSSLEDKTAFLMDVLGLRTPLMTYMQQRIDYFKDNENK